MAKKNTKKDDIVVENPIIEDSNVNLSVGECCSSVESIPCIKYLSPQELESYERMLRMLVLYYEQMLRIDEVEGRPVMSKNRNKYTQLSTLHKKLMEFIENKVLKLEEYVWED